MFNSLITKATGDKRGITSLNIHPHQVRLLALLGDEDGSDRQIEAHVSDDKR